MPDKLPRRWWTKLFALAGLIAAAVLTPEASFAQEQKGTTPASDARLQKAYRCQQGGWTYLHLAGSPSDTGLHHEYSLAPDIADASAPTKPSSTHQSPRD